VGTFRVRVLARLGGEGEYKRGVIYAVCRSDKVDGGDGDN